MCACRLEEERGQLEREHSRMPKKEELEQLIKQLTRETDSLSDEINMVCLSVTLKLHLHTLASTSLLPILLLLYIIDSDVICTSA